VNPAFVRDAAMTVVTGAGTGTLLLAAALFSLVTALQQG
jgi:hypothetical protein